MADDYYADDKNCIDRLVNEWKAFGKIIIDYDFDNTVFDYHNKGLRFEKVPDLLRQAWAIGAYCYCFTCDSENRHPQILEFLRNHNIPCDGINVDQRVVTYGGIKPYYNILLDDRAGLGSACDILAAAIEEMRIYKHRERLSTSQDVEH